VYCACGRTLQEVLKAGTVKEGVAKAKADAIKVDCVFGRNLQVRARSVGSGKIWR